MDGKLVENLRACFARRDETQVLEYLEVVRNCGPGKFCAFGKVGDVYALFARSGNVYNQLLAEFVSKGYKKRQAGVQNFSCVV